jgi:hypothetical protein
MPLQWPLRPVPGLLLPLLLLLLLLSSLPSSAEYDIRASQDLIRAAALDSALEEDCDSSLDDAEEDEEGYGDDRADFEEGEEDDDDAEEWGGGGSGMAGGMAGGSDEDEEYDDDGWGDHSSESLAAAGTVKGKVSGGIPKLDVSASRPCPSVPPAVRLLPPP